MSWQQYIENLLARAEDGSLLSTEAAVVGRLPGQESVWASSPGLNNITANEIKVLVGSDRSSFFGTGVTVSGIRCAVVNDRLSEERYMSLRTKSSSENEEKVPIAVVTSKQTLVILKGASGVQAGALNMRAFKTADYLEKNGY
ncbi:hypothetical protein LDENG_00235340 [Lucifuga dentata]|nr:hypothetical protein LDENG_00235340 [Lucifuga dentata]